MSEIIDGKNAVLGRLSTAVAKQLIRGESITVVNAGKIIITGSPKKITRDYLKKRRMGSPQHGPFYPKKPDLIVRRTIRGMLPKTKKGRNSLKRLKVHISIPKELENKESKKMEMRDVKINFIDLEELSKALGWKE